MSPIETRRDVSHVDDGILNVFDNHSPSNHADGRRRLDFNKGEGYSDKENFEVRRSQNDNSAKKSAHNNMQAQIDILKQKLESKDIKIEELNTRLSYYTSNHANSRDYASPRFIEPQNTNQEQLKSEKLAIEKVTTEITNIFELYSNLHHNFVTKFHNCINLELNELTKDEISASQFTNFKSGLQNDESTLYSLINLHKLVSKVTI